MLSVRPYTDNDREQVEKICFENAGCADAKEETQKFISLLYCSYYIEQEKDNCFVAVDDSGNITGYILCCENYNKYEKVYTENYIPQAASLGAKTYVDSKFNMLKFAMYRKDYPAHFFINVSLDNQNMGIGELLISTLKAHLRKKYIKGMMLVCDAENEALIKFFEKNGFKSLLTTMFGRAMALEIEK
ncbi:MAG: GNAT family N-acetyltransferase [Oscillospiraceae bacterium]|nr:GNAT family N-acetyltransferase [Oscillospiraceae bacterium]